MKTTNPISRTRTPRFSFMERDSMYVEYTVFARDKAGTVLGFIFQTEDDQWRAVSHESKPRDSDELFPSHIKAAEWLLRVRTERLAVSV